MKTRNSNPGSPGSQYCSFTRRNKALAQKKKKNCHYGQTLSSTKNEFQSLSRHFAGECKAICPPIEAQQKLSDSTG